MKLQILCSEIKPQVSKNDDLKLKLAKANGVRVPTIDRWLRTSDVMLTTAMNLSIIREELELDDTVELIEEVEPVTIK